MTDRDPLEDLLIDAATVDRGRIAKALNGIYGIDAKTGAVVAQPGFNALGGREKVLAYLLARRVAVLLGKAAGETALPSEVSAGTGITGGSARPLLRRLLQGHEVSRDGDGGYHLSHHQIAGALAAISNQGGGGAASIKMAVSNQLQSAVWTKGPRRQDVRGASRALEKGVQPCGPVEERPPSQPKSKRPVRVEGEPPVPRRLHSSMG